MWVPIVQGNQNFDKLPLEGNELKRFYELINDVQSDTQGHIPQMAEWIGNSFLIPKEVILPALPKLYIHDIVFGKKAWYSPDLNTVNIASSAIMPYFFGETNDLRETELYSFAGHELGHCMLMVAMCNGYTSRFFSTWIQTPSLANEFFARTCQRLICSRMDTILPPVHEEKFRVDDYHIAFAFADQYFDEIMGLPDEERSLLARDPHLLKEKYIPARIEQALLDAWKAKQARRERERKSNRKR